MHRLKMQSLANIVESGHSRFPVVNEDIDHVEGILLAKDLLAYAFNQDEEPCHHFTKLFDQQS